MNRTIIHILRAAAFVPVLVTALTACTEEAKDTDNTGFIPLVLNASVEGVTMAISGTPDTRAAKFKPNELKGSFSSEDALSLNYTNDHIAATQPINPKQTVEATYNGSRWNFTSGINVYLDYPEPAAVSATYPSKAQLAAAGYGPTGIQIQKPTATTDPDTLLCVDALQGSAVPVLASGGKTAEAALIMKHQHQLLYITVDARTNNSDYESENPTAVRLRVKYTPEDTSVPAVTYGVTTTKYTNNSGIKPEEAPKDLICYSIAPATPEKAGTYTLTGASITLKSGRVYNLTINDGKRMQPNQSAKLAITLRGDIAEYIFSNDEMGWNAGSTGNTTTDGYDLYIDTPEALATWTAQVNTNASITNRKGVVIYANAAKVLQTADLDLSKLETSTNGTYTSTADNWVPIGKKSYAFSGKFNGNGFLISNLKIQSSSDSNNGLFGLTNEALLTGIHLKKASLTSAQTSMGLLIGYATKTTVSLCSAEGSIIPSGNASNNMSIGGLIGLINYCSMTRCSATVTINVSATQNEVHAGGLVGESTSVSTNLLSTIASCATNGSITVTAEDIVAGGVMGYGSYLQMQSCCSTIDIAGVSSKTSYVGGLIGRSYATVTGCYATGRMVNTGQTTVHTGAIIASNGNSASNCYGKGTTSTTKNSIIDSNVTGQGTSYKMAASTDNIVYGDGVAPSSGVIRTLVSKAGDITPTTTRYNSLQVPAYGIMPITKTWKAASAWNSTDVVYPTLNLRYEGE